MPALNLNQFNQAVKSGGLKINYQPKPAAPAPNPVQQGVLGASTVRPSGVSGGGGAPAPAAAPAQAPYQDVPSSPGIDFDGLIAPALQALDESIGPLQSSYDTTVQGAEATRLRRTDETNQQVAAQSATLEQNRTKEQQGSESAANEARRQYNEIQQGIQAKYGGTTGTGGFATELAGSQTLRNIGDIRTTLSNAMSQIDDKLGQVKEVGRIALSDIEDRAMQEKSQAKDQLDSALADIRRAKGELQSRKAEMAMQAMQQYQALVSDIGARNTAFKQQLYLQQQDAETKLKQAMSKASSTAQSYTPQDFLSLAQQFSPLVKQGLNPTVSGNLQGGGKVSIGAFTPQKDDEENLF